MRIQNCNEKFLDSFYLDTLFIKLLFYEFFIEVNSHLQNQHKYYQGNSNLTMINFELHYKDGVVTIQY